jgi:hypothetical protein
MTDGKSGGIAGEIGVIPDFVRRIAQDTARIRRRMGEIAEAEAAAADRPVIERMARAAYENWIENVRELEPRWL